MMGVSVLRCTPLAKAVTLRPPGSPPSGSRVALPRAAQPGGCRVGRERKQMGPCPGASLQEEGPSRAAHRLQAGAGSGRAPQAATAGSTHTGASAQTGAARAEGHGMGACGTTQLLQEAGSGFTVSLLHPTAGCDSQ